MKIKVHFTSYILFLLAILSGFYKEVIVIFFAILFHELCHTIVARVFNKKLTKVTILPFGTIFEVDSNDNINLYEEFLIIIAGPLGSLFLMIFDDIAYINKVILIFNLLPIYPLDGGKLLEVILCKFLRFKTVMKLIYINSIIVAFSMCIVGLVYSSVNLVLIGFVFVAISFKNIEEIEMRYWKFLNDKLLYKRNLPLKKVKTISKGHLFRGYNNLYINNNTLLNEIDMIKLNLS